MLPRAAWTRALQAGNHRSAPPWRRANKDGSLAWFREHQLDLPLFRLPVEDAVVWNAGQESTLRLHLPEVSGQQLLHGRTRLATREEILLWFSQPVVDQDRMGPFSFQACCLAAGQYAALVQDAVMEDLERRAGRDKSLARLMAWFAAVEDRLPDLL